MPVNYLHLTRVINHFSTQVTEQLQTSYSECTFHADSIEYFVSGNYAGPCSPEWFTDDTREGEGISSKSFYSPSNLIVDNLRQVITRPVL